MSLIRWSPARELNRMHEDLNRLFSGFYITDYARQGNGKVNVSSEKKAASTTQSTSSSKDKN